MRHAAKRSANTECDRRHARLFGHIDAQVNASAFLERPVRLNKILPSASYFILFAGLLMLYGLGNSTLPLIDRDEPRFAEASREML